MGIILLILLIVCEIFLRIFGSQDEFTTSSYPKEMTDTFNVTKMTPNYVGAFNVSEFSAEIKLNSIGIRDREPSAFKGKKRMLYLGDSFTFGHGVDVDSAYVRVSERIIQEELDSFITINAGVPGTGPLDYFRNYKKIFITEMPELVTMNLFLGNDIHWTRVKNKEGKMDHFKDEVKKEINKFSWKTFLRENVHLYSFVVDRIKSIKPLRAMIKGLGFANQVPGLYVLEVLNPDESELYLKKWNKVFEYILKVKENSKDFRLIIVPTKEQVYEERIALICKQNDIDASQYDVQYPIEKIYKFAEQNEIKCINLLDTLVQEKEQELFFDIDPHFNEKGHLISGEYIANKILTDTTINWNY